MDGSALGHCVGLAELSQAVPGLLMLQLLIGSCGASALQGVLRINPSKLCVLLKGGLVNPTHCF